MKLVLITLFLNYFIGKLFSIYTVNFPIAKKTTQSQTLSAGWPHLALDKDINTCAIAGRNETVDPLTWWRIELDREYDIANITITNIPRTSYVHFLSGLNIYVSMDNLYFEQHLCAHVPVKVIAEHTVTANCREPATGKYITIKRSSGIRSELLVLCEVSIQIRRSSNSKSYRRPTSQSGILFVESSSLAVDENRKTCARILVKNEEESWWRVTLDDVYFISEVNLYIRRDTGSSAQVNMSIYVSSDYDDFQQKTCILQFSLAKVSNEATNLTCNVAVAGKYVLLMWFVGIQSQTIHLCEVYIYTQREDLSVCQKGEFDCGNQLCLSRMEICDGLEQCPDGIDELNCACDWLDYKCKKGKCISNEWLCDGVKDCPNGDDEDASTCVPCEKTQFKCGRNNTCISIDKRCDGHYDCSDSSDEQECLKRSDMTMEMQLLRATFKGKPDYYICETHWTDRFSLLACNEMGFDLHETSNFARQSGAKSIGLIPDKIYQRRLPFMAYFEIKSPCETGKYVGLFCHQLTHTECGTRGLPDIDLEPYIINGIKAKYGAWPWHVQVLIKDNNGCGGSLVDNQWVITSAHCLRMVKNESMINIKLGTNVLDDPMVKSHTISNFVIHPNFIKDRFLNDVAIIKLQLPVQFTDVIRSICLPKYSMNMNQLLSYRYCVVSGFGEMAYGYTTKYLRQGKMNVMSHKKCAKNLDSMTAFNREYFMNILSNSSLICAGTHLSRLNTCTGDGGGPLVCRNEHGRWIQIGIVSFSYESADGEKCSNSILTRVDSQLDFIRSNMQ